MDFFDDIYKGLIEAKQYTVEKTGELTAAAKLTFNIQSEKAKLNRVFRDMGKLLFEAHTEGGSADAEIEANCKLAEVITQKIALLEEQLSKLRQKTDTYCSFCKSELKSSDLFCPMCGQKQSEHNSKENIQ